MKRSRHALRFATLFVLALSSLTMISCVQTAKYQLHEVQKLDKGSFHTVLVVPLRPIGDMSQGEFLDGEAELSSFVKQFCKGGATQVVAAEQIRKDMNLKYTDDRADIRAIAARYGADHVFIFAFRNLRKQGYYGGYTPNGYIEGDIIMNIADGETTLLTEVTGFAHFESGFGAAPKFNSFIRYAMKELDPKLQDVLGN